MPGHFVSSPSFLCMNRSFQLLEALKEAYEMRGSQATRPFCFVVGIGWVDGLRCFMQETASKASFPGALPEGNGPFEALHSPVRTIKIGFECCMS